MGFWSDLFKKGKDISNEQVEAIHSSNIREEQEDSLVNKDIPLEFDSDGWICYPDGVKLKIIDKDAYLNYEYQEIIESLGYHQRELYADYYNDYKSEMMFFSFPEDSDLIAFSELFTDKLIFILRHDGKTMTIKEVEALKTKMKYNQHSVWGLRRHDLLLNLGYGIEEQNISRQFIEKVFNCSSNNDVIDVDRFHFEFYNDMLYDCTFDGYDIFIFQSDISYGEINDYFKFANKSHRGDGTMKKIINNQSYCLNKIDDDILNSDISRRKFAYDYESDCINYIAMAAFYKQCDVEQDLFISSTDGQYEILSKENHHGESITKIRAYHEVFTFINGHSMPEQSFWDVDSESSRTQVTTNDIENGYIYVMINSSFEGLVKIGKTTRDPNERAKELSSATGVPTPFIVVYYKSFANCNLAEKQIHKYLEESGCRVNDNREFFNISTTKAIEVVQTFFEKEQSELNAFSPSRIDLSIFDNNEDEAFYNDDEPVFDANNIFGKWKSSRLKHEDSSVDIYKDEFAHFEMTILFNHDFSFQDDLGRLGSHSGTFEVFGRYITTYLDDGEFIVYKINSLSEQNADMTLILQEHTIQIEFEKQD